MLTIHYPDAAIQRYLDGTFKPAYSNNMAWRRKTRLIRATAWGNVLMVHVEWALYVIGQYCDQSVPDGFGCTAAAHHL
ncbi:hypothetical protein ACLB1N_33000 [Escherichia coli]